MPYAFVAARLNSSVSTTTTPSLRILTSMAPDCFIADKIFSVLPSLSSQYKSSSPITRTPALTTFPINKPIKPSLQAESSNPGSFGRGKESSASIQPSVCRNALPSSSSRKSVRFRDGDDGLVSICFFHATGRPSALLDPDSDSDTESDTESDDDSSSQCLVLAKAATAAPPLLKVTVISSIPSPHTQPYPYIYLESLSPLTGARPPLLRGIVRVRNIAFEKRVAARFTVDDWTTVSEVLARYTGPGPTGAHGDDSTWDRFAFSISLEFYAPRPRPSARASHASTDSHSTLLLAVSFSVPGIGEWWDNNGGGDFSIVLASAGSKTPGVGPTPAAEFPRRPRGVTCFADVQAAMACTRSLMNPYVVTN